MQEKLGASLRALVSSPRFLYGGLVMFCGYAWWEKTSHLDLLVAIRGQSPVAYVYRFFYKANFVNNFPSVANAYNKSAFMHFYKLAYAYLGITPEALMPVVVAIEIAIMAWAVYALCRTLLPNAPPVVLILATVLVIASDARNMSFAYVGQNYFIGLYYNVADALRIFAIIQFLKGFPIRSGALLAGSFTSHPIMGLFGFVFIQAMALVKPRAVPRRRVLAGALVFIILSLAWLLAMTDPRSLSNGEIPRQAWLTLTKLNNFHWYPHERGLLTTNPYDRFIPFLSFLLLVIYYLNRSYGFREVDRKVVAGFVAMMGLVGLGLAISVFALHPGLIKMALHGANDLVVTLGLVYIVGGLWRELATLQWWRGTCAALILCSPFLSRPGFPLLFSLFLVAPVWREGLRKEGTSLGSWLLIALSAGSILLVSAYVMAGVVGREALTAFVGGVPLLLTAALFGAVLALPKFLGLTEAKNRLAPVALVITVAFFAVLWLRNHRPLGAWEVPIARDYKQAQLWARANTPTDALFMTDPIMLYGWRDYSRRSSFGTFHEWLCVSWMYTSDLQAYREGMKRFNEFSVDLDPYTRLKPFPEGYRRLSLTLRKRYYSAGDAWRITLAKRYGIDYFVLRKDKFVRPSSLPVVYENERFVILSASEKDEQAYAGNS